MMTKCKRRHIKVIILLQFFTSFTGFISEFVFNTHNCQQSKSGQNIALLENYHHEN